VGSNETSYRFSEGQDRRGNHRRPLQQLEVAYLQEEERSCLTLCSLQLPRADSRVVVAALDRVLRDPAVRGTFFLRSSREVALVQEERESSPVLDASGVHAHRVNVCNLNWHVSLRLVVANSYSYGLHRLLARRPRRAVHFLLQVVPSYVLAPPLRVRADQEEHVLLTPRVDPEPNLVRYLYYVLP